ncbi:PLP-dependent aminotransferase family protein [Pseudomonas benzenivorans]|uniref:PLP-dependent aminotransferase family protein n=1 Tax=Pseudomonas benzenivorans TaxID=556533 RepID=A0ABZ0PV01_9PSED|nr:PLP-dependent aminotransferase family protein [Pseudomonas benzenivorans]WPC05023.1 PLP-dependent aminotransferase family protein [Pseudomonas benzenivorans]
MELHLALDGRQDLAGQLYRQLRAAILDGRLAAGDRLPSMRFLAERLAVSRKTVGEAYERLVAEGFLQARVGSGTYVSSQLAPVEHPPMPTAALQANPRWRAIAAGWRMPAHRPARYSFAGGTPDKRRFPFDAWRTCLQRALRLQARSPAFYAEALGNPELRLAISRYLAINRAVRCHWQDILVSQGAQQAIDLLARVMLTPGDLAVVEEPGYPPARLAFEAAGARVLGVPVDREGLRVDCLPEQAKLVYVTPSHQFPLGQPMSLPRRLALLEWARRRQALIIEDDYDGEYRFDGRPLESLQSLDREGRVAYIGTFSKTLFPELRLGYLLMPAALRGELTVAKQLADQHSESLQQLALAHFIGSGAFAQHTRRLQREYARRRQLLLRRLAGDLAPWLEALPAVAGIHLAARLRQPLDCTRLCAQLAERGVLLLDLAPFYAEGPGMPGLLFGFGAIEAQDIDPALDILHELLRQH